MQVCRGLILRKLFCNKLYLLCWCTSSANLKSNGFAIAVNLDTLDGAFDTGRFVDYVEKLHINRDKGFEEQFKVNEIINQIG